jgi:hypothetical protein
LKAAKTEPYYRKGKIGEISGGLKSGEFSLKGAKALSGRLRVIEQVYFNGSIKLKISTVFFGAQ